MNHDTNTLFIREIRRIVLYTSCLVLGHIQVEKAKCPLSSLFELCCISYAEGHSGALCPEDGPPAGFKDSGRLGGRATGT